MQFNKKRSNLIQIFLSFAMKGKIERELTKRLAA